MNISLKKKANLFTNTIFFNKKMTNAKLQSYAVVQKL